MANKGEILIAHRTVYVNNRREKLEQQPAECVALTAMITTTPRNQLTLYCQTTHNNTMEITAPYKILSKLQNKFHSN